MPTTFCRHVCCVDGARSPRCAYPPPFTPSRASNPPCADDEGPERILDHLGAAAAQPLDGSRARRPAARAVLFRLAPGPAPEKCGLHAAPPVARATQCRVFIQPVTGPHVSAPRLPLARSV